MVFFKLIWLENGIFSSFTWKKTLRPFCFTLCTYTFVGWILWQCTILCQVTNLWQKWQKFMKQQKILTLMPQNCDYNVTKFTKKVVWIFLISWLCTIFRFSIILWTFCHKIVSPNVQVLWLGPKWSKQSALFFWSIGGLPFCSCPPISTPPPSAHVCIQYL